MSGYVIPKGRTEFFIQHPECFNINTLEANEMSRGDHLAALAKIPKIEGRIRIEEKDDSGNDHPNVRLVIGRETDEETGEIREKTVILGYPMSRLAGMMYISLCYHDYFDTDGNLIYDPMSEEEDDSETEAADVPFDARKLTVNEFELEDGTTVAKIPEMAGRVFLQKAREDNGEEYVRFVTERGYDPNTHQSRNLKVTIGKTIREFPGMMIPNDKYHDYFDANGVLINDPMKDAEEENGDAEPDELNEITGEPQTEDEPTAEEARTEPGPERAEEEKPEELAKREAELNKRETEIMEKEALLVQRLKEAEEVIQHYKDSQRELDSIVMVRLIQKTKAEKDHIELLRDILYGYFELIEKQAGKKSAMPMSRREIRKINELLSEIREIFRGCETEEYLTLANEPSPPDSDHKDSEEEQGTTYGEMAIILRTYHCTMHAFSCGRLHMKEEITEEDTEMI